MKSKPLLKFLSISGFLTCVTTNVLVAAEGDAKPLTAQPTAPAKQVYKTIHGFRSGLPYTSVVPVDAAEETQPEKKAKPIAPAVTQAAPAKPASRPFFAFLFNPPPAKKAKIVPVAAPEVAPKAKPVAPAPVVAPAKPAPRPFFAFLFNPPPAKKAKIVPPAAPEVAPKAKPVAPAPAVAPAKPASRPFAFLFNQPAKKPKAAPAPKVSNEAVATAPAPPRKSFFSFLQRKEPPRALVVEQSPAVKKSTEKPAAGNANHLELPGNRKAGPNDGLRLPDMLTLPGDNEFESTNPAASKTGTGTGAVIARPPTDPPSRPKIKEKDGE